VFDSEVTVAGKGWKTYALCAGISVFSHFNCDEIWLFCSFFKLAYNAFAVLNG
jgi:hypothetical protein